MSYAQNKTNNMSLNYQTVADMLYTDACRRHREFGTTAFEISDFQVFMTIMKSGQPHFSFCYFLPTVAEYLNQIRGCTATYHDACEKFGWDGTEEDGYITLVLTEAID